MNPPHRPPTVLIVHNGSSADAHGKHLTAAGLRVSETHADMALAQALRQQPDIIVLDCGCDAAVTAQLKGDTRTEHIPVIALDELTRPT
jgi:CheY-like chemotaxis protein